MNNNPAYPFAGDKQLLLDLYREYVSPEVQLADLECADDLVDLTDPAQPRVIYAKGAYNPYNRWNTTGGIMHLTHPANSLSAEIHLGAEATILRQSGGRPVIDPEALICCSAYGGLNRTSDPTIGSTVNELAALGAYVTLPNPVGLAMHHIDLVGIATPHRDPIDESFFRVLRGDGSAGLIERAVFEVPAGEDYTVSDLTIGGTPISHGGQLAERIAVNIVGRAGGLGTFQTHLWRVRARVASTTRPVTCCPTARRATPAHPSGPPRSTTRVPCPPSPRPSLRSRRRLGPIGSAHGARSARQGREQ